MTGLQVTKKIHVRETRGWHINWRWAVVWLTQLVYYGLPWLLWDGRQIVLLDFESQKFFVFGFVFWPQDLIYLAFLLVVGALLLFLSTTIVSRVWCGFACPHTVYTEIFQWVERQIEGGRSARIRLASAPASFPKFKKKLVKHGIWILIAGWTGLTFVGYFTPIRDLIPAMLTSSLKPWALFWGFAYGTLAYLNAGWMRDQVCRVICPYSRFQGAMMDRNTLVIEYDQVRGEPRGLRNRKQMTATRDRGDCIDCTLCVQVCPVGIDIREGLQHDCTGCGACYDACDLVMEKIGATKGLIRYASNGLSAELRNVIRPRVLIYAGLITAVSVVLVVALGLRVPLKLDVARDRADVMQASDLGEVENVYRLHIVNADVRAQWFRIEVAGLRGISLAHTDLTWVSGSSSSSVTVRVRMPGNSLTVGANHMSFRLQGLADENLQVSEKAVFFMPHPVKSEPYPKQIAIVAVSKSSCCTILRQ